LHDKLFEKCRFCAGAAVVLGYDIGKGFPVCVVSQAAQVILSALAPTICRPLVPTIPPPVTNTCPDHLRTTTIITVLKQEIKVPVAKP
jgi:hypothetical protein